MSAAIPFRCRASSPASRSAKPFADPIDVKAIGHLGKAGTDEYTAAILKFPGDIIAQVATGVQLNQENVCRIYGTDGSIYLPTPWVPSRGGGQSKIIVHKAGEKEPQEITVDSPKQIYGNEADYVAANAGEPTSDLPRDELGRLARQHQNARSIGAAPSVSFTTSKNHKTIAVACVFAEEQPRDDEVRKNRGHRKTSLPPDPRLRQPGQFPACGHDV